MAVAEICFKIWQKNPRCLKARSALKALITAEHATVIDLVAAVSTEIANRYLGELADLWQCLVEHLWRAAQRNADEAHK